MSSTLFSAKMNLWRDDRANQRELKWECLVPAHWAERPESVRPALGDVLLSRFDDPSASIRSELSASFVDREVAPPHWLSILTDARNERAIDDPNADQQPHPGVFSTEYTSGRSLFRRTTRVLRNGPWMLFATVTAPAEVHAAIARETAAMLLSFHPLNPSQNPPEARFTHTIDGAPVFTFDAPASWTSPGGETELQDVATASRSLVLREGEATLALMRVRTFAPGTTSPQRALAQQLAPMRHAGTTFEGSPIVPLGGDTRWDDRFMAEVAGRNGETPLTGYFRFLRSDRGAVAIWTLSFSRDTNAVVWAIAQRAGEIAAGCASTTITHESDQAP